MSNDAFKRAKDEFDTAERVFWAAERIHSGTKSDESLVDAFCARKRCHEALAKMKAIGESEQ